MIFMILDYILNTNSCSPIIDKISFPTMTLLRTELQLNYDWKDKLVASST